MAPLPPRGRAPETARRLAVEIPAFWEGSFDRMDIYLAQITQVDRRKARKQ